MAINPGTVLKSHMAEVSWPLAFTVSGLAFTGFFLQTGLDLHRTRSAGVLDVVVLTVEGAAYGTLGIAVLATVAWALTLPFRAGRSLSWTLRAFGLAYSGTLVYVTLGVAANLLLGWNTAVVFGVTGVLWALGPTVAVLQEMVRGKLAASLVLATVCGALLLYGWAWLGMR